VFDPFDLTRIQVRYQGRPMGVAVPYRIARHSHPRARPETEQPAPPVATGINYLDLVVTAHEEHLQAGVNYAALACDAATTEPEPDAAHLQLQAELDGFAALARSHSHDRPTTDPTDEPAEGSATEQIPGQLDLTELLPEHETTTEDET
jgi:hypothetical protein